MTKPFAGTLIAKRKSMRGFAGMKEKDPDRQKVIAALGGKATPNDKRSFSQDRDLAAEAGRKGGRASRGGGRHQKVQP